MSVLEIYLKSEKDVHEVADLLRRIWRLPDRNRSAHQVDQQRESAGKGGVYYLFECFGLVLELLRNEGEALIPEYPEYPYYVVIYAENPSIEASKFHAIVDHLCSLLAEHSIDAIIDSLT